MSLRDTPFIQDGKSGKRVTPGWLAYIFVFVVLIIGVQGSVGAIFASTWAVTPGTPEAQLQEAISFAVALLALILWVVLFERRSIASLGFRKPGKGVLVMLLGVVVGIALQSIPVLVLLAGGIYETVDAPTGSTHGVGALGLLLLLLAFVIIQGGTEEVLTRGFLLQNQGLKLPGWAAVLIPALVFTIIHGVILKPFAFASILFYALLATFLVLRLGSLWLVIGIHAGWNFAMGNIYGIAVSGLPAHTTSWLYSAPTDAARPIGSRAANSAPRRASPPTSRSWSPRRSRSRPTARGANAELLSPCDAGRLSYARTIMTPQFRDGRHRPEHAPHRHLGMGRRHDERLRSPSALRRAMNRNSSDHRSKHVAMSHRK